MVNDNDDLLERVALEVACPLCKAPPHEPCRQGGRDVSTHAARLPRERHYPRRHGNDPARSQKPGARGVTCEMVHGGKTLYSSRHKAEAAASRIRKYGRRHDGGKPIRPYRCRVCGKWALTSKPM